jgi:NADH-quinone oxidoreductase subunit J
MDILYIIIKACIFISILLIFWFDNPIHAILCVVCHFLLISIFLFYFNVEFLAYMYILVYVGAVAIFFLFATMLLNINTTVGSAEPKLITIFYFIFIVAYLLKWVTISSLYQVHHFSVNRYTFDVEYSLNYAQSDYLLFSELYVDNFYLFFITSLILLITMVGAVGVCLKEN